MKKAAIIAHFCVPAIVTVWYFGDALSSKPFSMELFINYVFSGYLCYAAPHLLWAVVAVLAKFSNAVWHTGFIAASIALAVISALSFLPGDPSGLPYQWLLYWPLAIILQVFMVGLTVYVQKCSIKKKRVCT